MVGLRLATLNLFSGRSLSDGRIDPAGIVTAVAALDADVLAVQEVDHGLPRSGGLDQAVLLARALGARDHRFVQLVTGTPGMPGWHPAHPDDVGSAPGYGIALASRLPVVAWHVLHLAAPRGRWPIAVPSRPPRLRWLADEPRAVVAAVLDQPPLIVAGTHLSFVPGVNAVQARRARTWLAGLAGADRPIVLMGDLNLPGRLPGRLTGWTSLVTGPTFPAPAPKVQLDHVLLGLPEGAPAVARTGGRIVELSVGDHRAVVAEIEL